MPNTFGARTTADEKLIGLAVRPFAKSIEQGAATTVYCATAPELTNVGGQYFRDCREYSMSQGARDTELARRLWEQTEEFIGKEAAPAVVTSSLN